MIDKYASLINETIEESIDETTGKLRKRVRLLTTLSLIINVVNEFKQTDLSENKRQTIFQCLFFFKIIASILSNSLSIISSVVDSAVDLVSSLILFWTARAIRNRNQYRYPAGRTRLEPVAIIILSVIMCSASVEILAEALKRLLTYVRYLTHQTNEIPEVNMNIKQPIPIAAMCITISKQFD